MHTSRKLVLIAALLTSQLWAQTTTTITGTIKDLTNAVVTSGKVTFTLTPNRDTTISGIARFTPTTVTCLINGSGLIKAQDGTSTCTLTMNTALSPSGTYYTVAVWPYNVKTASFTFYAVLNTYDWSTVVPTPATSPAQNYVDVFSNQTIGGNKTFTGAETFSGATTINLLNNVVYATPGESLATALAQLGGPGKIVFGEGTYPSGGAVISIADVTIEGAGMPTYNSITAPTALVGGTIIQGEVDVPTGGDRFSIRNIGIDVGPAYINASNGGVAQNGLAIYNPGQVVGAAQIKSPVIQNVSCLGYSPNAAVHCMLVENVNDASITNIATTYNVYGLAFKGTNSTISGVWARSHGTNGIIIKSDTYAPASNVNLSNFNISNVTVGDLNGGLYLLAIGNQLSYVNVSDGTILNPTTFGMFLQGGNVSPAVSEINISNVTIDSAGEPGAFGILMTGFDQFINFANLNISNVASGIHLNAPSAGIFNHVTVSNSNFAFITANGVETFDFASVTGSHFTNMVNGIVSNSSTTAVSNNVFVGVTNNYATGNVQFGGVATIDNSSNVLWPAAVAPGHGAIASFTACSSSYEGAHQVATNCNAGCVAGNTCTGGGATHCEMYCNSSPAWVETGR